MKLIPYPPCLLALQWLFFLACSAQGSIAITVNNTNDSGPGSLRQAISDTTSATEAVLIVFDESLEGQTIGLDSEITITHQHTLIIKGKSNEQTKGITLDGKKTNRIFKLTGAANVDMENLLFTGGNSESPIFAGHGGAVQSHESDLSLRHCGFINNTAISSGTGLHFSGFGAELIIRNCTFTSDPAATNDNGPLLIAGGTAMLVHCTLEGTPEGNSLTVLGQQTVVTLQNSIVVGDLFLTGKLIQVERNIIGGTLISESGAILEGTTAIHSDPMLAPLADNGGPQPTMAPLPGSPAIDPSPASSTQGATTDQRGSPRSQDGDGDGLAAVDIGAVEAIQHIVKNTNDSGTGSLRQAVADANLNTNFSCSILFDPDLAGETISPRPPIIRIASRDNFVSLHGSHLIPGVILSGSPALGGPPLEASSGSMVRMDGLTFANSREFGFQNAGDLIASGCLFTNNTGSLGGGLFNQKNAELTNCTFSNNHSESLGGAIRNQRILTLRHCTLIGNTAADAGGGIYGAGDAVTSQTFLFSTVVADNLSGPDLSLRDDISIGTGAHLKGGGSNVVNALNVATPAKNTLSPPPLNLNPRLLPLGEYGGSTKTMPPSAGSPLIDAASVLDPAVTTDQRGIPRGLDGKLNGTVLPDVGAVEVVRLDRHLVAYYDFEELGDAGLANKAPDATGFDATRGQPADWSFAPVHFPTGPGFEGLPLYGGINGGSDRSELIAGNALNLDSALEQFIRVPLGSDPAELGISFTISSWHALTPGVDNDNPRFFVFEANSNFDVSWGTPNQPGSSGPLSELRYNAYVGGQTADSVGSKVLATGPWHHVAHVFNSNGITTTLSLYINGIFSGSHSAPTSSVNFSSLKFGNARDGQSRFWDGMIDEVGLWSRALTTDEVAALYQIRSINHTLNTQPGTLDFNSWIASSFPGITDPDIIGPAADPDSDKLANEIEYLLGGNPHDSSDAGRSPTLEFVGTSVEGLFSRDYLLFQLGLNQTADATYIVETSTDLTGPWVEVTPTPEHVIQRVFVEGSSGIDRVELYISYRHFGDPAFFRLRVDTNTP